MSEAKPLRRRRRVVERAGACRHAQRRLHHGAELLEVGARHRAADALEVGGELAPDIAAIEIVEPGVSELLERGGKRALLQLRAHLRHLAVDEEGLAKADGVFHFRQFLGGQARLAARHRVALARVLDRGREQHIERQPRAERLGRVQRQHPGRHRARHGERRERAARRDLVVAGVAIGSDGRLGPGPPRAHQRPHAAGRRADQPEAVAADMIHVRIDRGDRRGHGEHGFDRIAAFGQEWRGHPRRRLHAARIRRRGGTLLRIDSSKMPLFSATPR